MKRMILLLALAIGVGHTYAQNEMWKGSQQEKIDTTSLLYAFKKGKVNGHIRYFFMATDNQGGLTDYYANAIGGGIKYETAPFRHFQVGASGFFIFNIGSSDLTKPDPRTNAANKYEIGLFDVQDPANKSDIDRLEELYIKYSWKKSRVVFGRQLINTPFINLQDGRMRPSEVGGLYAEINDVKNTKIEGGYLFQMSPRGTVKWFHVGESIGLYPQGLNPDGTKSGYAGNISSKGIALLGLTHQLSSGITVKAYNVFVENVFNTILLESDYTYPLQGNSKLVGGLQFIRQDAVKSGGNPDPSKAYFEKGSHSLVWGARVGWENKRWQTSLNYTRVTNDGRFLMPREWGREPFFTFLPRERNDGAGDIHAIMMKTTYSIPKARLRLQAAAGYYDLPDVANYRLNKFGMPSYTQFNVDVRHEFTGFFQGLDLQFLYVYKGKAGNVYNNDKYVINKVNMSLWNVVFNYHF